MFEFLPFPQTNTVSRATRKVPVAGMGMIKLPCHFLACDWPNQQAREQTKKTDENEQDS